MGALLAKLLRLNILATTLPALILAYVAPFLYYINYKLGSLFIKGSGQYPHSFEYNLSFWDKLVDFFAYAGSAYLLGSAVNAILAAAIGYFVFLYIYKNAHKFPTPQKKQKSKIKKKQDKNGKCHVLK